MNKDTINYLLSKLSPKERYQLINALHRKYQNPNDKKYNLIHRLINYKSHYHRIYKNEELRGAIIDDFKHANYGFTLKMNPRNITYLNFPTYQVLIHKDADSPYFYRDRQSKALPF